MNLLISTDQFFCWPSHCRFRTAGCERVKVGFVEAASRMDLVLQAVEGFWSGLSKPFVWNSKMRLTPNRCKEIAETDANRIRSLSSQSSSWAATSCGDHDHGQVSKSYGDWWRRWKVADLGPGTVFVFSGSVLGWSPCHQRSILKHTEESIKAQLLVQRKRVQILHTRVINLQHLTATLYTIIAYFLSDPACPGFIRFSWQIMADYMHEFSLSGEVHRMCRYSCSNPVPSIVSK